MKNSKVILYGHFGTGNIGNDSSFEAALYHVKKLRPDVDIVCICSGPREISERFGIQALSMSGAHAEETATGGFLSRLRRLWHRVTDEISFWLERPRWFRSGDLFIVVGTGAVDDMAVRRPWHAPYELYKWCKTAKLGGARVIFLSVGVGPIMNRISKFLMLKALKMADYRSYREQAAFDYLHGIGYDTTGDLLYPDVVFSLPLETFAITPKSVSSEMVIGLGLLNYYGWRHDPSIGESVYQEYLSKIKHFAIWLLRQGYKVRIISGDTTDRRPVQELKHFIGKEEGIELQNKLTGENITDVRELFNELAQTDIVVASRFHNVLCALMLERPVISIGYHEKNTNLMTNMGLGKYCQHIEEFTVEKLVEQFECYLTDLGEAVQLIHSRKEEYRQLLDEQYSRILLEDIKPSS